MPGRLGRLCWRYQLGNVDDQALDAVVVENSPLLNALCGGNLPNEDVFSANKWSAFMKCSITRHRLALRMYFSISSRRSMALSTSLKDIIIIGLLLCSAMHSVGRRSVSSGFLAIYINVSSDGEIYHLPVVKDLPTPWSPYKCKTRPLRPPSARRESDRLRISSMINPSMGASFQVRGFNPRTCTLSGLDIKVSIPLPLIYQLDGL